MFRFILSSFLLFSVVTAKSRFVRQTDNQADSEGSGLQFIDFTDGSASNPIVARDQEGSGAMYDEEGSATQLLFDTESSVPVTQPPVVLEQSINVTDSDVDTLVIKVHLPQRSATQLLDELKDDSAQQTPLNTLNTAVSLTSVLNELLGRIQDASSV